MAHVPLKVIPVMSFRSILPRTTVNQGVHLDSKEIRQSETACHKRLREHEKLLLSAKLKWRLGVDLYLYLYLYLYLDRLLRLE